MTSRLGTAGAAFSFSSRAREHCEHEAAGQDEDAPDTRSSQGSARAKRRSTARLPIATATARSHSSTAQNIHAP